MPSPATPGQERTTSKSRALLRKAEIALVILGLLSPVVTTIGWLVARSHFDLVIWIDGTTAIYPTPETENRPLSLTFHETEARSVALSRVRIRNEGKESIGAQSIEWWLDLYVVEPGQLSLREETAPRVSPARTRFLRPTQEAPNRLRVRLGILEPGAEVDLDLILVNLEDSGGYPRIKVNTNLAGIPEPLVTHQSVSARFTETALLPSLLSILVVVIGAVGWSVLRHKQRLDEAVLSVLEMQRGWRLAIHIPRVLFLMVVAAAVLAIISGLL